MSAFDMFSDGAVQWQVIDLSVNGEYFLILRTCASIFLSSSKNSK